MRFVNVSRNNIRSYKKMINELAVGETFYYNSIAGTISMINYTRELIQTGKIAPVREEIEQCVTPDSVNDFMTGKSIFPQMEYVILK